MTLLTPDELHQWRKTYPFLYYLSDSEVMDFASNHEAIQRYHNHKLEMLQQRNEKDTKAFIF